MKIAKPIKIKLGVTDCMIVITALNYVIEDMRRHELDRELALDLKNRVLKEIDNQAIEVGGE